MLRRVFPFEQTSCSAVLCASLFTTETSLSPGRSHPPLTLSLFISEIVSDFKAPVETCAIPLKYLTFVNSPVFLLLAFFLPGHSFISFIVRCGTVSASKLDMSRQAAESSRAHQTPIRNSFSMRLTVFYYNFVFNECAVLRTIYAAWLFIHTLCPAAVLFLRLRKR